ncbi:MAG TPA: ATPase, T2SS/T4P/T4SS family [Rubrobacteraceae bacterium]|nr:ATPase, T2SS/T4P/T4SS family [Rubrobacteraceae bacterium]
MLSREGNHPAAGPARELGEYLVAAGLISEGQADAARDRCRAERGNLAKSLVSLGYLSADEVARALAKVQNVEYVDLSKESLDPDLISLIAEDVLLRHGAVPLRAESGRLIVAMADPGDTEARSDLTISAGHPVTPVVASEEEIRRLHRRHFGTRAEPSSAAAEAPPSGDNGSVRETRSSYAASPRERPGARRPAGRTPKIGEILISEGKLSETQLQEALTIQRNDPRDLGEILISLGLVEAEDLARALARRLKLDFVVISELSESEVDPDVLNLIEERTLRKYTALPLRFEDGRLVVAMSNPNDLFALEDLRIMTKHQITPVVATFEDISGALSFVFGDEEALDSKLDEGGSSIEAYEMDEPAPEPEFAQAPPTELAEEPPTEEPSPVDESPEPEAGVDQSRASGDGEWPPETPEPAEGAPEAGGASRGAAVERGARRLGGAGTRIGDILLAEGKVSAGQLEEAQLTARERRQDLGKTLLSLGYVSEEDLARALAARLRLEFVELTERDVDRAAASLVDQRVLRRLGAMPLRVSDGRLVVAMSDPTNIYALEDLRMISGYPVTPVVALETEIRRVQNKLFAVGEEVTELLQEAAGESVFEDHGEVELGGDAGAEDAPIVRLVGSVLQQAVGEGASDVHIEPRARELTVRYRVDGVLREVMSIPPKLQSGVIARLKILANLNIAERRVPQDGRFSVRLGGQKIDVRAASLPTVFGEKIVLRLLDTSNVEANLEQLGFRTDIFETYEQIFRRPYGAILVTGPTGSGKSTTLYATLSELNSPERNIITVEDPVEFRMEGINQIQVNAKAGLTFASGLRSILRSDPDVVMIGEIRDFETAKISVEAALTGHLVLATLHTNNAPSAVNRLTDMGVEPFLTSSAVDCVIAQRLARRLCDYCKEPVEIPSDVLADINFPHERAFTNGLRFHRAVGCDRCGGSGYRGRLGIYEMMVVTPEIRDLILRRVSTGEISRVAEEQGMVPLRDDGLLKAAEGLTTIEEVLRTVV